MEQAVALQGVRLALGFVLGVALGVCYDFVRPLRRRCGRGGAAALDVAFALVSGLAAFAFAMGAGSGKMGLWELAASLLGFAGYMHTLSDAVYAVTDGFFSAALRLGACSEKIIKNSHKQQNFSFKKRENELY